MVIRPYERATIPTGIVSDFFEHALQQVISPDWVAPAPERESVNATPGRDQVELIRHLHRRSWFGWPLMISRAQILDATTALSSGVACRTWQHNRALAIASPAPSAIARTYRRQCRNRTVLFAQGRDTTFCRSSAAR